MLTVALLALTACSNEDNPTGEVSDEDYFGTLNIGNGVKVIGLPEQGDWFTIPVAYGQVGYAQWRCHVQLATCDHPGYTAETCIFCKH
jgi:hypothetical protein